MNLSASLPRPAFTSFLRAVLVATVLFVGPATAWASECFPSCRKGFVCAANGQCVSECNPPCEDGFACSSGACVAKPRTENASKSAANVSSSAGEASSSASTEPSPISHNYLAGGIDGLIFDGDGGVGFALAYGHVFGSDHGFVLGGRVGVYFPEDLTLGRLTLDLGYRGIFLHSDVNVGLLVLVQPGLAPNDDSSWSFGGTVAPLVEYKHFHVQVPIGVSYFQSFDHDNRTAVGINVGLLGGVAF